MILTRARNGIAGWLYQSGGGGTSFLELPVLDSLGTDADGGQQPKYYTDIITGRLASGGEILVRDAAGIHTAQLDDQEDWDILDSSQPAKVFGDQKGPDCPMGGSADCFGSSPSYYETLQLADIDGDKQDELLGRAADGLRVKAWRWPQCRLGRAPARDADRPGQWRAGATKVKRKIGAKRERGSREGLTRVQAEKELRRRMEADAVVRSPSNRRTIAEAGEEYVDHLAHVMERKATTIVDYRGYVRGHFAPFLGDRPISRIDESWVSAYLKHKRSRGLSAKTVQNHLNFMHGLFKFAKKHGWCETNPVAEVERPKKTRTARTRIRFLRPVELEALIRAVPDDELGAVERPLYRTAVMTGLRQDELIALPWIDVDWLARRIRVADNFPRGAVSETDSPKSWEGRSVPMADSVAAALERHSQQSAFRADRDLVFGHPQTGAPLDPSKIRKRFKQALERARVREVTFHELRHTFGTQLAAAGVPLRTIQEWMGHADAKTTEVYRHYAPDPTHGADLVEGAFGQGGNLGGILSKTQDTSDDLKRLYEAESDSS